MARRSNNDKNKNSSTNLGFEAKLRLAADSRFPFAFLLSTGFDRFRRDHEVRWQDGVPLRGNANFSQRLLPPSHFAMSRVLLDGRLRPSPFRVFDETRIPQCQVTRGDRNVLHAFNEAFTT